MFTRVSAHTCGDEQLTLFLSRSSLCLLRQGFSCNPKRASLPTEYKDLGLQAGHHTHSDFFFNVGIAVIIPSWQKLYPLIHLLIPFFLYKTLFHDLNTHQLQAYFSKAHIPQRYAL